MAHSEREVIAVLLQQLESEERALSRRRQKLHARIATFPDTTGSWAQEEREISDKRRALHRQIDALRKSTEGAPQVDVERAPSVERTSSQNTA